MARTRWPPLLLQLVLLAHLARPVRASCRAGKFVHPSRLSLCLRCPRGKHTARRDSQACASCAPGRYDALGGARECRFCPRGKLQPLAGRTRTVVFASSV